MAEQFSMPSMFDTQYAMDRQMELDAQKAGQVGGGGKRYGMYYNSSLLGDRDNASLMSLTGMLGGQGDPRMAKQQVIDTIRKKNIVALYQERCENGPRALGNRY